MTLKLTKYLKPRLKLSLKKFTLRGTNSFHDLSAEGILFRVRFITLRETIKKRSNIELIIRYLSPMTVSL